MRRERAYHEDRYGELISFSTLEALQKRGFVMSTSSTAKTVTAHRGLYVELYFPRNLKSWFAVIVLAIKNARDSKKNKIKYIQ